MTEKTYFQELIVGGLMMKLCLERNPNAPLRETLKQMKKLTERVLVWVVCPKCGLDVPAIDMTKDGYCFFCYARDEGKREEGNYKKTEVKIR